MGSRKFKPRATIGFILVFLTLGFGLSLVFYHTSKRQSSQVVHLKKSTALNAKKLSDLKAQVTKRVTNPFVPDEWCEARDYIDLSSDPVFADFNLWMSDYQKVICLLDDNCTKHDPRKILKFLKIGEKLAIERKKVFEKIIRGDPAKAISMALSDELIKSLPNSISKNLESWKNERIDLDSIHVCYDPNHPEGLIKRWSVLSDGTRYRVWTHGKRKKMQTVRGIASWGVTLGEDFAMSSHSYRQVKVPSGGDAIQFADRVFSYKNEYERNLFIREIENAESEISVLKKTVSYPIMAGSSSLTEYYEKKYDLISTPMTWSQANARALLLNGRLVVIQSQVEQDFVYNQYDDGALGFDPSGNSVKYGWIGATDSSDQNGSNFDKDSNTTSIFDLNATEGDWRWLSGDEVSLEGFSNWEGGVEPNDAVNTDRNFAALDWNSTGGAWVDINESYELPFLVEYDLGNEPATIAIPIKGFRKVLIVPARFQDEGWGFNGSSAPLTDQFGNTLYPELQKNSFEPVSQERLAGSMEQVTEYFRDNSDGAFNLIPVISPTVTIPFNKYSDSRVFADGTSNPYDSNGSLVGIEDLEHEELPDLGVAAIMAASQLSEKYNILDNFFWGVQGITTSSSFGGGYKSPPAVSFRGGNLDLNGLVHPDFMPCKARAIVNGDGNITAIEILDPGQYYYSNPTVLINGSDIFNGTDITATAGSIAVSWVAITTHEPGAAGLGYVGGMGSHVDAVGGYASWGVIAHELGHNFGLLHANRFISRSERPNSDEGEPIDYGNPFAVMGSGSGHMTMTAKVAMRASGFGYVAGTASGSDVSVLTSRNSLQAAATNNLNVSDSENNNTFRIYRHDYEDAPLALSEQTFQLSLPDSVNLETNTYSVQISGTGEGASAVLDITQASDLLIISKGGKGFSEEPIVEVLNDNNETILRLDPSWIRVATGTESTAQAVLRNVSEGSPRGLRGVVVLASPISPIGEDSVVNMDHAWIEYRREASDYGLSVLIGQGTQENYWIDMTPATRDDFSDAFLMPGHTFSDYSTDTHITPIAKGGVSPMEYIDVVVNVGSVAAAEASAPVISLDISNQNPFVGEYVTITARVNDGNSSDYAYSWFTNEKMETSPEFLNQPTLYKSFTEPGEFVLRVVVSDMKGGLSSRNIVIKVGDYNLSSQSSLSGTVRSPEGFIQGARVEISPAEIIEHKVSVTGNPRDLFLPTGTNNPLHYTIDGQASPDLVFNRGEIHRFTFDAKADGFPISFFEHHEHELPSVRLNMLVLPVVDIVGDNYVKPPEIVLDGGSSFSSYFSDEIGTIVDFQLGLIGNATKPLVVTRPYAKALLSDTNVTAVRIRPTEVNDLGLYIAYGGKGHHRDNPPNATVHRTSFWEDYNDTNATAKAYVDGVGTISPVNALNPLGSVWETRNINNPTPKVVVWGTGAEHNATVVTFDASENQIGIAIHNQGAGFEPNATMAVLHYPHDPMALWTFDIHESLFDDANQSRFQPSPAWNRDLIIGLTHYWAFDEENGTILSDSTPSGAASNLTNIDELSESDRSQWGAKRRSVHALNSFSNPLFSGVPSVNASDTYTISLWVKPDLVDSVISLGGNNISFISTTNPQTFTITGGSSEDRLSAVNGWSHIAVVTSSSSDGLFYIDGQSSPFDPADGNLAVINIGFPGLIDELQVYSKALSDEEIRYLAGRSFLDLSGNKYHAVPIGPDFSMSNPDTNAGSSTDRPQDSTNNSTPGKLGDSFAGENNGRSVSWDDNDSYLDLSLHATDFAGVNQGTISFWIRTSGLNDSGDTVDQTVFCASDIDDNQSYFRIMVRDIGVMQLHAVNDGTEISKFYTDSNGKITHGATAATVGDWHHVVLVVDDLKSAFWIDGQMATSMSYSDGTGDNRAFFSDIENIDFMAIGLHRDANFTNSFTGNLDDFHIYDRPLDSSEILYLYELKKGREQIPRLQALVDAVGTVTVSNIGVGYKELPEVELSYGQDGNVTDDLHRIGDALNPDFGDIAYDDGDSLVKSRYVGYTGDHPDTWREYQKAYGTAELNGTSVDRLIWTKDTFTTNNLLLPNDRNITRRFVEYVQDGNGSYPAPSENFGAPTGLFGYTAPPKFSLSPSDSGNQQDDATGYALFFLDQNKSAEIISKGIGLVDFSANAVDVVRISGKGFRPEQVYRVPLSSFEGESMDAGYTNQLSPFQTVTSTQIEQPWRRNPNNGGDLFYGFEVTKNAKALASIQNETWHSFGENNEYLFGDWTQQAGAGEPRDVTLEFSNYISSIKIADQGYGYSVPVEAHAVGGYPTTENLQNWVNANPGISITFIEAELNVTAIDATGGLVSIGIVNGGEGYEVAPEIMITGGGGHGASATCQIENGTITNVNVDARGRGYFNLSSKLTSTLAHDGNRVLGPTEKDANVTALLGGYLHEVGICPCAEEYDSNWPNQAAHAHLDPWIEIWDRNRSEADIDSRGDRAIAAAKVRNGIIEKVVVVNGGRGYVDPVIYVRGTPPNRMTDSGPYNTNPTDFFSFNTADGFRVRTWRCTNLREAKDGSIVECGHIQSGNYAPEFCPGETDSIFTATDDPTIEAIEAWKVRHEDCAQLGYSTDSHFNVNFQSRVCSGTKANFVLLNDPYRTPYENWEVFDAQLTPLVSNGKITEIKVEKGGSMYAASDVRVAGTGSGVDIIPIYDMDGFNTHIIFDDPKLRNLETDYIPRPLGTGQGFQERPWSLDNRFVPTNGLREIPILHHYISLVDSVNDEQLALFEEEFPFYRNPNLGSAHGDRVAEIRINDSGAFDSNSTTITLTFDGSHRPDLNGDGQPDFTAATADITITRGLSGFALDANGTFSESHDIDGDDVDEIRARSLFVEEPVVNLVPGIAGITTTNAETASSFFRLNGLVDYSNTFSSSYFDLYVDNRLPHDFFYGLGTNIAPDMPGMGGSITIMEALPDGNSSSGSKSIYTDQHGFYSLSGLEAGLYNVTVYMEDEDFQESTFRPDANESHVTRVIYVPGLPTLIMESDQHGKGISRMIWSRESRELARPASVMTLAEEEKTLEGIGAGFQHGTEPQLVILPHPENTSTGQPKLDVDVLIDGSLTIKILDDFNTSTFNTNDRFTVTYSSSISGVDFHEDYFYSESDGDGWSGSGSALEYEQERLIILPSDGNGTNAIEVPLSSASLPRDQLFTFQAVGYEQNGSLKDLSTLSWELISDFNASEGNNSKLGSLSNSSGSSTDLTLFSTLRRGRVDSVKILAPGSGYSAGSIIKIFGEGVDFDAMIGAVDSNGGIVDVNISNRGTGYIAEANFMIEDSGGSDAVLQSVLGGGEIRLQAKLGTLFSSVRVYASQRTQLTEEEKWLDLYLDTIEERNASWWNDDLDLDGLSNLNEFNIGTHPNMADTDGDGLTDFNETDPTTEYQTNPLSRDTDGDGLFDGNESIIGTNPLISDTDRDGYTDYEEVMSSNLDPLLEDSLVNLSGLLYANTAFSGDLYFKLEVGSMDNSVNPSIAIKLYENNETFIKRSSNQLPQQFQYANLLAGRYYRLSGYIDLNGNLVLDSGELYVEWEGYLSTNKAGIELTFKDVAPDINFQDQYEEVIQLARGESFQISVLATDYPDDNWTGPLIENGTPQNRSVVLTGTALDVLQTANNQATANNDAKFGTYSLFFTAYDLLGTASEPLERQIEITDKVDPVISVQNDPYPWPLGTVWDPVGIYSATDDPDGNITSSVIVKGFVDPQTIGQYPISLYVEDSFGRSTTKIIAIEVADLSPPVIRFFEDDPSISWLLGQPFNLPENYVTALDNVDGDLTAQIVVSGLDQLDENTESNQTIYFSVTDLAGNRVDNQALTISFQPSTFTIAGLAIDGYLSGSLVEFKAANSEASNLTITAVTDENGSFNLAFLAEDFLLIDTNKNNVIDPEEGSIIVSGGLDTTTSRSFDGALSADANSSIVSPLTTILSEMIKSGLAKNEAQIKLAESFGYSTAVDITTYDPISAAKYGDSDTVAILQANALVVNTLKQVTAIAEYSKLNADKSELALEIAGKMSDLAQGGSLLKDALQSSTTIGSLIENTYIAIDQSNSLSDEDLSSFVSVLENSNVLLADSSLETYAPGEMLKKLSQKQIAVEEEVIEGISQVSQGILDLSTLQNNADLSTLQGLAEQILSVNNFGPEGKSFKGALGKSSFQMGEALLQLDISDADGDAVSVSLVDENDALDVDGDNLAPLGVNSSYQIVVLDASDLQTLLNENVTLTLLLKLDDGNGKTTLIQGVITKSDSFENTGDATQRVNINDYSLLDAVQNQETSWYSSSWFGDFYPGQDGWLYHLTLGWLYLHPSGENGFWIWDSYYDTWWWSSKDQNIFPYFYLHNSGGNKPGWGKFENLDSKTRVYEYFNEAWKER